MTRKTKLKVGDFVNYLGDIARVNRNEYLFRNKPVIDLEGVKGLTGEIRVAVGNVSLLTEEEKNKLLAAKEDSFSDAGIETVTNEYNVLKPELNKYQRQIINAYGETITVDVYDVLDAFNVNDAAVAHAIKKLLAPGQRGSKSVKQDLQEAIQSVNRAIDREDSRFLRG